MIVMTESYLGYFNKLVDEYNSVYHHYVGKKPFNANYSPLTEEIETNLNPILVRSGGGAGGGSFTLPVVFPLITEKQ